MGFGKMHTPFGTIPLTIRSQCCCVKSPQMPTIGFEMCTHSHTASASSVECRGVPTRHECQVKTNKSSGSLLALSAQCTWPRVSQPISFACSLYSSPSRAFNSTMRRDLSFRLHGNGDLCIVCAIAGCYVSARF